MFNYIGFVTDEINPQDIDSIAETFASDYQAKYGKELPQAQKETVITMLTNLHNKYSANDGDNSSLSVQDIIKVSVEKGLKIEDMRNSTLSGADFEAEFGMTKSEALDLIELNSTDVE